MYIVFAAMFYLNLHTCHFVTIVFIIILLLSAVNNCDLGKRMFPTESNFIEIYILIVNMGASFTELEEVYRRILVIPVSSVTAKKSCSKMRIIKTYN